MAIILIRHFMTQHIYFRALLRVTRFMPKVLISQPNILRHKNRNLKFSFLKPLDIPNSHTYRV